MINVRFAKNKTCVFLWEPKTFWLLQLWNWDFKEFWLREYPLTYAFEGVWFWANLPHPPLPLQLHTCLLKILDFWTCPPPPGHFMGWVWCGYSILHLSMSTAHVHHSAHPVSKQSFSSDGNYLSQGGIIYFPDRLNAWNLNLFTSNNA